MGNRCGWVEMNEWEIGVDGWKQMGGGVGSVVWQRALLALLACVAGMAGVYGVWRCHRGQYFHGIS